MPTTSAGARLGAAAMTAANSRDAVAAAAHDVAAPNTAKASQPSSTWARTAPGRPSASAARNGGASAHSERGDGAERAALGEARGGEPRAERRSGERHEPEQHERERRRPERERAEHGEHAGERVGGAHEPGADVAPPVGGVAPELGDAPDSGSSPPPPTPPEPSSQENRATDAAADASSTQPPPVPMNCSSCGVPAPVLRRSSAAAWRRRRSSSGCMRSGATPTSRGARGLRHAPGARDAHAREHRGERGAELAGDRSRPLHEQQADRAEDREREEASASAAAPPAPARNQAAVQLGGPRERACCAPACSAATVEGRSGDARPPEPHARCRARRDRWPARRARTPRSSASSAVGQRRIEPVERLPDACAGRGWPPASSPSTSLSPSCWPWSSSSETSGTLRPSASSCGRGRDAVGRVPLA